VILATVGTQLPFPRMIAALDRIAGRHALDVFAQTADAACMPRHLSHAPHLAPDEFAGRAADATLLVGHAGIGTVLTAKKLGKPLIVYPRRFALGEHRNDHQMATARTLADVKGIHVAWDDDGFEALLTAERLEGASMEESERRRALIARLRAFVGDG
jgi:UDP-N-acetylglucosamine transferase subunit ALG13